MEARNPQYTNTGMIDLEINHPVHGWIPFTASPDDVDPLGPEIYSRAVAGEYGPIAAYVPPPPPPVVAPSRCTRGQGRLALLDAGHLIAVEAMIAGIADLTERMRAQIEYERETWERSNPFLQQMWANLGGTPEELDDLFTYAVTR